MKKFVLLAGLILLLTLLSVNRSSAQSVAQTINVTVVYNNSQTNSDFENVTKFFFSNGNLMIDQSGIVTSIPVETVRRLELDAVSTPVNGVGEWDENSVLTSDKLYFSASQESAPNAVTSPTGAKATVNETSHGGGTSTTPQQKVNPNALFTGGASKPGGNTSGNGGSTGHGDELGLSSDIGYGYGYGGGTGRRWVKKPEIPKVAVDKDEKLYLDFDVDENGNLTNIRLSTKYPSTTQDKNLINQCIEELKTAKFQPGPRTNGTYLFNL